jgi:hypothetical protein
MATLFGEIIVEVSEHSDDHIVFHTKSGKTFEMYHMQDCCESVEVYDISGNLQSLVGEEVTFFDEDVLSDWPSGVPEPKYLDSYTWTIYRIGTANQSIMIRWVGYSNGYYSERPYFEQTHKKIKIKDRGDIL